MTKIISAKHVKLEGFIALYDQSSQEAGEILPGKIIVIDISRRSKRFVKHNVLLSKTPVMVMVLIYHFKTEHFEIVSKNKELKCPHWLLISAFDESDPI